MTKEMQERFADAVQRYAEHIARQGYSQNTVRQYLAVLNSYAAFIEEACLWDHCAATPGIMAYVRYLNDKNSTSGTIRYNLKRLSAFFDFAGDPCLAQPLCEGNPVASRLIPRFKTSTPHQPPALSEGEYVALVTAEYKPGNNLRRKSFIRRNAMTVLLLTSGLREQELIDLVPADLSPETSTLVVRHGKGDKRRIAPYTLLAQRAVGEYLKQRPRFCDDNDPLFGSCFDFDFKVSTTEWRPLSKRALNMYVLSHIKAVIGRDDLTVHSLRASCATHWHRKGADILDIKDALGHANIQTTYRYLRQCSERDPANRLAAL